MTPTPKEGPPTLRECREILKQLSPITWRSKKDLLARLTDEALERDEEIHGNSPEHWYTKAMAYKGIVFEVCEAFRKLGYKGGFHNLETLAERLDAHAEILEKRRAALEKVEKAARRYKHTGVCHSRCGSGPADGLIPQLGYGDCTCGNDALAEALLELDALTPTPKDSKPNTRAASGIPLDNPYR